MPSQPIPLTLIKGDKHGSETDYRDYLPENMSGIMRPVFGAQGYMLQQPGLTKYGEGIGIDRGGLWNERLEQHFRVSGNSFIKVSAAGASTVIGAISGLDTASLPYSFNTQGIVADGRFWLSDGLTLTEVTDPDLGDPIDATWIDGYYFFTDGENLYHTDIADETQIDPLKFATAEFSPDPTLGVGKTVDNKAIAFGRYSIEYFANRASENFAFTRIASRALKSGIVGTHCKCEMMNQWFIMGGRKEENVSIHAVGVGSTNKIASREVDKIIGQYSEAELTSAVLEARVEDNYHYLIVHLPNEVLLWNAEVAQAAGTQNAWSILKSDVEGNAPWRAKFGLFEPRLGKWVYGDKIDNTLGILDETVATHYGELAEWLLYTPFTYLDSLSIDELEIETIPGFAPPPEFQRIQQYTVQCGEALAQCGEPTAQCGEFVIRSVPIDGDDATVFISLTYNGVTHGSEWTKAYGKSGDYGARFIVRRLGYVSDWVGVKMRGASRSRMAFSRAMLEVG